MSKSITVIFFLLVTYNPIAMALNVGWKNPDYIITKNTTTTVGSSGDYIYVDNELLGRGSGVHPGNTHYPPREENGRDGQKGGDGKNLLVIAPFVYAALNVKGSDGQIGEHGLTKTYSQNSGKGGNGGVGGSGGHVCFITEGGGEFSTIYMQGGKGGGGGQGGFGTYYCSSPSPGKDGGHGGRGGDAGRFVISIANFNPSKWKASVHRYAGGGGNGGSAGSGYVTGGVGGDGGDTGSIGCPLTLDWYTSYTAIYNAIKPGFGGEGGNYYTGNCTTSTYLGKADSGELGKFNMLPLVDIGEGVDGPICNCSCGLMLTDELAEELRGKEVVLEFTGLRGDQGNKFAVVHYTSDGYRGNFPRIFNPYSSTPYPSSPDRAISLNLNTSSGLTSMLGMPQTYTYNYPGYPYGNSVSLPGSYGMWFKISAPTAGKSTVLTLFSDDSTTHGMEVFRHIGEFGRCDHVVKNQGTTGTIELPYDGSVQDYYIYVGTGSSGATFDLAVQEKTLIPSSLLPINSDGYIAFNSNGQIGFPVISSDYETSCSLFEDPPGNKFYFKRIVPPGSTFTAFLYDNDLSLEVSGQIFIDGPEMLSVDCVFGDYERFATYSNISSTTQTIGTLVNINRWSSIHSVDHYVTPASP